jgi:hypothetical protein
MHTCTGERGCLCIASLAEGVFKWKNRLHCQVVVLYLFLLAILLMTAAAKAKKKPSPYSVTQASKSFLKQIVGPKNVCMYNL